MAKKNYKSLSKRLKKQLGAYKRKEKSARNKLRAAVAKMNKMGRSFKRKIAQKAAETKSKVAAAQSSVYARISQALKKKGKVSKKSSKKKTSAAPAKKRGRSKSRGRGRK